MVATMDLGIQETGFEIVGQINTADMDANRVLIGIPTIDQIFGDKGLMPGMIIQVAAAPGVGKTTLLLPILDSIVSNNPELNVGYISGEEDVTQLAYNAARIGVKNVQVANMSDVDRICDNILPKFNVIVIDSFQTLHSKLVKGKNKVQMYAISRLVKACKDTKCILFTICHQTKDGKAKGDSGITHAVDATVHLTKGTTDDYGENSRIITVDKNRFGQNGSVVLRMTATGYDFTNPLTKG